MPTEQIIAGETYCPKWLPEMLKRIFDYLPVVCSSQRPWLSGVGYQFSSFMGTWRTEDTLEFTFTPVRADRHMEHHFKVSQTWSCLPCRFASFLRILWAAASSRLTWQSLSQGVRQNSLTVQTHTRFWARMPKVSIALISVRTSLLQFILPPYSHHKVKEAVLPLHRSTF